MKISNLLADEAILAELGERITRRRLDLELTQAAVAEQPGITRRTLERIEARHSAQLSSLIRILRVQDGLTGLRVAGNCTCSRCVRWRITISSWLVRTAMNRQCWRNSEYQGWL